MTKPHRGRPPRGPVAAPARPVDEAALRQRVAEKPGSAGDWQMLGAHLARTRRPAEAAEAFQRAIAAGAPAIALAGPLGLALSDAGKLEEAVAVIAAAQAKRPRDLVLTNLLGVALKRAGRLAEAIPVLEAARRIDPRSLSPWQNLGNVYDLLGRYRESAAAYEGGVRLAPRDPEVQRLHGRALLRCGDYEGAQRSLERSFAADPRNRNTIIDLTALLIERGTPEDAFAVLARARQAHPADGAFHDVAEARCHYRLGRAAQARAFAERAVQAAPGDENAHLLLSLSHGEADPAQANAALRAGLAAIPGSRGLTGRLVENLARARYGDETAHLEEAYGLACRMLDGGAGGWQGHERALRTVFQRCLDLDRHARTGALADLAPQWVATGEIAKLHYELGNVASLEDRVRIVEWHRDWGRREAARIAPLAAPAIRTDRPLRIGFMSSDLRNHPVSYFALPLLEQYDRERFEVFCYSFSEHERDPVQAAIEKSVTAFRWWPRRPDAEIAAGIAADGLDMLFELGGVTAMNRLSVMAYRPARIGASWLGYPHSSGLERIDYILTDPYLRPEDPRLLIEQPFELPETWVALGRLGFYDEPIAAGLPEERRGHLTFGTMNNPYKFNDRLLDAWAACLRGVPDSRFLFVRPEGGAPAFIANARRAFAARDVDPARIEFLGVRGRHLPHYNAIDIALDSFPHTGGTTTCETLWMGVPVVSLVGPGFPERLSYSNLSNAGLGDLAVRTEAEYVATVVALAGDRARRRMLRQGLRAQLRAHPLGQVERFTRAFYDRVAEVARR